MSADDKGVKVQTIRLGPPAEEGSILAPGCIKATRQIPVTRNFDGREVIGVADVEADGSATIVLAWRVEGTIGNAGLGFRVIESHEEPGGIRVFDEIEPITVGVEFTPKPIGRAGGQS